MEIIQQLDILIGSASLLSLYTPIYWFNLGLEWHQKGGKPLDGGDIQSHSLQDGKQSKRCRQDRGKETTMTHRRMASTVDNVAWHSWRTVTLDWFDPSTELGTLIASWTPASTSIESWDAHQLSMDKCDVSGDVTTQPARNRSNLPLRK